MYHVQIHTNQFPCFSVFSTISSISYFSLWHKRGSLSVSHIRVKIRMSHATKHTSYGKKFLTMSATAIVHSFINLKQLNPIQTGLFFENIKATVMKL